MLLAGVDLILQVTIVEEAVKYIDILHERFMKRFNSPEGERWRISRNSV